MKRSILIINSAGSGASGPAGPRPSNRAGLTSTMIRSACAGLCDELGISAEFREAEDQDTVSQWLLDEGHRSAGIIFNTTGLPETPASAERRRAALLKLASLKQAVIEVCPDNLYGLAPTMQPLHEPAGDAGFICGLGIRGFLLAIRSIVGRPGVTPEAASTQAMQRTIFILNGPSLNLLGMREPELYGTRTLQDLATACREVGAGRGLAIDFRQTNHEGELVEWIQEAIGVAEGIIINAAAYTHTSIAIHDALRAFAGYKIELHISNPRLREEFRHVSYVSSAVDGVVAGLGPGGYELVVGLMADILSCALPKQMKA